LIEYGGTMIYRDGRRHRWYGSIANLKVVDPPRARTWEVSFLFTQTDAYEVPVP